MSKTFKDSANYIIHHGDGTKSKDGHVSRLVKVMTKSGAGARFGNKRKQVADLTTKARRKERAILKSIHDLRTAEYMLDLVAT